MVGLEKSPLFPFVDSVEPLQSLDPGISGQIVAMERKLVVAERGHEPQAGPVYLKPR
jgi:hypothetical protein